jgi:HAE1 family hydrophobic/amphiphilic exporter-1
MALGLGEGAELRAPLAVTVIGGLVVATVLTLVMIPVVYSVLDRKRMPADAAAPDLSFRASDSESRNLTTPFEATP